MDHATYARLAALLGQPITIDCGGFTVRAELLSVNPGSVFITARALSDGRQLRASYRNVSV